MGISARSLLVAGLSVTAVSASVVCQVDGSPVTASAAPAYRLSAAVSPLLPPVETAAAAEYAPVVTESTAPTQSAAAIASAGDFIINAYNTIEPWVAWGFELVQWGMGLVPGLWWFAPGVDLLYFTWEPVVQSLVYSFAYLIDGNFSLIGPTIQEGIQQAAENFVQYSIYWFESLIPFPPLPPWPPFPGLAAAAASTAGASRGAAATAATDTVIVETTDVSATADSNPTEAVTAAAPVDAAAETASDTAAEAAGATAAETLPDAGTEAVTVTAATTETTVVPAARGARQSAAHARTEAQPAAPAATTEDPSVPQAGTDVHDRSTPRSAKAGAASARSGR